MNHYRATHKTTAEVVEYDADQPQPEHLGNDWRLEAISEAAPAVDDPQSPPAGPRRLTKLQFVERLGDVAFVAILQMAKQSVEVEAFVERFRLTTPDADGTSVDLDDPRTVAGVTAIGATLHQLGTVGENWVDGVLNGN
jgi:hypothetical protein